MMRRLARFVGDQRGVAAIEFALIIPILTGLVLFGLDGWLRINQVTQMGLQLGMRAFFVCTHEPAVPGDIGRQDGGKPSLHALAGQALLRQRVRYSGSLSCSGCARLGHE